MIKSSLHSNGPRRGTVLASCWPFDVPRCRGCLRLGTGSQGSRNRVGSNATPLSFGVVTKFNQFRCFSQPCRCCVRVLDHPSSNHAYIYLYLSWGRDQKANRHSFSLSFQLPHRFVTQWCDHLNRREHSTPYCEVISYSCAVSACEAGKSGWTCCVKFFQVHWIIYIIQPLFEAYWSHHWFHFSKLCVYWRRWQVASVPCVGGWWVVHLLELWNLPRFMACECSSRISMLKLASGPIGGTCQRGHDREKRRGGAIKQSW